MRYTVTRDLFYHIWCVGPWDVPGCVSGIPCTEMPRSQGSCIITSSSLRLSLDYMKLGTHQLTAIKLPWVCTWMLGGLPLTEIPHSQGCCCVRVLLVWALVPIYVSLSLEMDCVGPTLQPVVILMRLLYISLQPTDMMLFTTCYHQRPRTRYWLYNIYSHPVYQWTVPYLSVKF